MTLSEFNEKLDRIVQLVPSGNIENIRVKVLTKKYNTQYDVTAFNTVETSYFRLDDKGNLVKSEPKLEYMIHYDDYSGYVGFLDLRRMVNKNAFDSNDNPILPNANMEVYARCCDSYVLSSHTCSYIEDITLAIDTASGIYTALINVS